MTGHTTGVRCAFGAETFAVFVDAYRLASKKRVACIPEEAILIALVEKYPSLRREFGTIAESGRRELSAQTIPLRGGLDRPAFSELETSDEFASDLREIAWTVRPVASGLHEPPWSHAVIDTLQVVGASARSRLAAWVRLRDIVDGLFDSPSSRVREILERWSIEPFRFRARISALWPPESIARPYTPTVDALGFLGTGKGADAGGSRIGAAIARVVSWYGRTTPVLACLESEAVRQAVRLGHDRLTTAHLLLGVLSFNDQIRQSAGRGSLSAFGSRSLIDFRVTLEDVVTNVSSEWENVGAAPRSRRHPIETRRGNPRWSASAAQATASARSRTRQAPAESHSDVLVAAIAEYEGASLALRTVGVDADQVARAASDYAGGLRGT